MKRKIKDHTLDYLTKFALIIVITPISIALIYHLTNLSFYNSTFLSSETSINRKIK